MNRRQLFKRAAVGAAALTPIAAGKAATVQEPVAATPAVAPGPLVACIPSAARLGGQLIAISRQYKDKCFYRTPSWNSEMGSIEPIYVPQDEHGYTGFFTGDWIRVSHTGELWEIKAISGTNDDGQRELICQAVGAIESDFSIPNSPIEAFMVLDEPDV